MLYCSFQKSNYCTFDCCFICSISIQKIQSISNIDNKTHNKSTIAIEIEIKVANNNQFMQDTQHIVDRVNPSRIFYYRNRWWEQNLITNLIVILFLDIVQCTVSVSLLLKFFLLYVHTQKHKGIEWRNVGV